MNCKPSDLAMIIRGCSLHIGRLHTEPIFVRFGTEIKVMQNITLEDGICHIDAWLMPLIFTEQELLLKQADKELAEVV